MDVLGLSADAQTELRKLETLDFNIFKLQAFTRENELMVVSTVILQKEGIFHKLSVKQEAFLRFEEHIQRHYFDIPYHNKTHGADVCQVSTHA